MAACACAAYYTGPLPYSWSAGPGSMPLPALSVLDLSGNDLTGPVPNVSVFQAQGDLRVSMHASPSIRAIHHTIPLLFACKLRYPDRVILVLLHSSNTYTRDDCDGPPLSAGLGVPGTLWTLQWRSRQPDAAELGRELWSMREEQPVRRDRDAR
jgi:hypothetical protein